MHLKGGIVQVISLEGVLVLRCRHLLLHVEMMTHMCCLSTDKYGTVRYRHLNLLPQHMALNLETHAKLGGVVYTIARSVPVRRVYPKSLRPGRLPPHPQRFFSSSSYPTNEAVMNVMPVRRSTTRRASVVEMSEMRDEMYVSELPANYIVRIHRSSVYDFDVKVEMSLFYRRIRDVKTLIVHAEDTEKWRPPVVSWGVRDVAE
ncbi:hypothetical protein AXG93_464s1040 [Marchantia polymorpha subsp. ruderalis]|uniref:Uncharacterized protein n=1 Tax=Marchantia polymorpha subsp. ruderalis TaxID=1480154 RepID=A0A176WSW5_MARPO|nr:hypothetical protein AXG93_464s1040 [Marchantia polymorpha subsp. ruderalis]